MVLFCVHSWGSPVDAIDAISPEAIRELGARREGTALDFKRDDYDWDGAGRIELAKDLMAIANSLAVGQVGFILIGVDEADDRTGTIVGVPAGGHFDDADLHGKVSPWLNRTPVFSYAPVEVDGLSVGAYRIQGGGRPFFSLRDHHKGDAHLFRYQPLLRNGSSTEVASPDQVVQWAREDDPLARRALSLQAELYEAGLTPQPMVEGSSYMRGPEYCKFRITITNGGSQGFSVSSATWELVEPEGQSIGPAPIKGAKTHVVPGSAGSLEGKVPIAAAQHLLGSSDPREVWARLRCVVVVECRSPSGRTATREVQFRCV